MSQGLTRKVIHVTTVHPWWDNRIYEKMVSMLPQYGWDVTYIAVPSATGLPAVSGVTFVPLRSRSGLTGRVLRNLDAFRCCLRLPKQLIHFHDPEFLPFAILLRLLGWRVIYDIHEDNFLGVLQKPHIPGFARHLIAYLVAAVEQFAVCLLTPVIAEKAYLKRFPRGTTILNYLKADELVPSSGPEPQDTELPRGKTGVKRLLYTGSISIDRGAFNHVDLLKVLPDYELYMIGRCERDLESKLVERAGDASSRLHLIVHEDGIPYAEIEKYYRMGGWDWGLAVFPKTDHYYEKELTKFFEYMFYRIPILCSNFPVWKSLIERNGVGITISPENVINGVSVLPSVERQFDSYRGLGWGLDSNFSWESQFLKLRNLYLRVGE